MMARRILQMSLSRSHCQPVVPWIVSQRMLLRADGRDMVKRIPSSERHVGGDVWLTKSRVFVKCWWARGVGLGIVWFLGILRFVNGEGISV